MMSLTHAHARPHPHPTRRGLFLSSGPGLEVASLPAGPDLQAELAGPRCVSRFSPVRLMETKLVIGGCSTSTSTLSWSGAAQPWLPPAAALLLPLALLAAAGTFCSSPVSRALISEGILPWSMAEHHCLYCRQEEGETGWSRERAARRLPSPAPPAGRRWRAPCWTPAPPGTGTAASSWRGTPGRSGGFAPAWPSGRSSPVCDHVCRVSSLSHQRSEKQ